MACCYGNIHAFKGVLRYMPRHRPPAIRDEKLCSTCGRPFQWRKKWEKVWDEVKYCSDRCRTNRNPAKRA